MLPMITHGSATVTLTTATAKDLRVAQRKMERFMRIIKKEDFRGLNGTGHVARM